MLLPHCFTASAGHTPGALHTPAAPSRICRRQLSPVKYQGLFRTCLKTQPAFLCVNTLALIYSRLYVWFLAFGITAPKALHGAPFEEYLSPYSGPVMYGEPLYVEYDSVISHLPAPYIAPVSKVSLMIPEHHAYQHQPYILIKKTYPPHFIWGGFLIHTCFSSRACKARACFQRRIWHICSPHAS